MNTSVERVSQDGSNGASANLVTPTQDENAPPQTTSKLTVGQALPPLGSSTYVPPQLFRNLPREFTVRYSPGEPTFPEELCNIKSESWEKADFLKKSFPITYRDTRGRIRSKSDYKTCPFSILHLASDLDDRMILYNWWIQLSDQQQKEKRDVCKKIFLRYTKDSELAPQYNPNNPKVVLLTDSAEMRQQHLRDTDSYRLLNRAKERKKASSPVRTNPQLRDRHVQQPEAQCVEALRIVYERTVKDSAYVDEVKGSYEPIFVSTSTVYSPPRHGKPRPEVRLQPRRRAIARNADAFNAHISDVAEASFRAVQELNLDRAPTSEEVLERLDYDNYYFENGDKFPAEGRFSAPQQLGIRTLSDISNDNNAEPIDDITINLNGMRFDDDDADDDGMDE